MESGEQQTHPPGVTGDENAGMVNFVHVLVALMVVGLIVAYIAINP